MKRNEWTRGRALGMAYQHCAYCRGGGIITRHKDPGPCGCVCRAIFRACLRQFYFSHGHTWAFVSSAIEPWGPSGIQGRWDDPRAVRESEYCADFLLLARRVLPNSDYNLYRMHYLRRQPWRHCVTQTGLSKAEFFHACYRIEERLGRACADLSPYALFPVYEYFEQSTRPYAPLGSQRVTATPEPAAPSERPKAPVIEIKPRYAITRRVFPMAKAAA